VTKESDGVPPPSRGLGGWSGSRLGPSLFGNGANSLFAKKEKAYFCQERWQEVFCLESRAKPLREFSLRLGVFARGWK
jgi:hypothetical protein